MRMLMVLWDGAGTVPVEVGAARRLVQAGHAVTVLGEPGLEPEVVAAGVQFRSWECTPYPVQDRVADWEVTNPHCSRKPDAVGTCGMRPPSRPTQSLRRGQEKSVRPLRKDTLRRGANEDQLGGALPCRCATFHSPSSRR